MYDDGLMQLRCTNCGAVLERPPFGTSVHCHFCGAEEILAPPPAPHRAPDGPPLYSPSPELCDPDDADVSPPPMSTSPPVFAILLAVGLVAVVLVVVIALSTRKGRPATASATDFDAANLATLSLHETPEEMGAIVGATANASLGMRVRLKGSPFDYVRFTWDKADLSHVQSFSFDSGTALAGDAAARRTLQELLGRRLQNGSFSWGGGNLNYLPQNMSASATLHISNRGRGPDDPHWKDRLDTLWAVGRKAVGLNVPVSDAQRRAWLGLGYPLSSLRALDVDTDVDGSVAMMQQAFPGTVSQVIGGLDFDVALDHPWFGSATFNWPNAKGGRLTMVRIGAPPGMQYLPNQADIETCLEATFGKSHIVAEDHLKGTHRSAFKVPQGQLGVSQGSVDIDVDSYAANYSKQEMKKMGVPPPMEQDLWSKIMATLASCGQQ